ncbi:MAG TPA: HPr family phosphocarrier protein [Pseudomonadales bacterium]|nr:HPr family phosphocarrier protein [Pseudomonadales bacterium]
MIETTLDIINKLGLHARAASKLTTLCARFKSSIVFYKGTQRADGKSIMSLMLLAAGCGTTLQVHCDGADEQEALAAVKTLFADRFGEPE